jgi:maltooligosyltrehalose trehalohydrolase
VTQPRLGATPGDNLTTEFRVWAPSHDALEVALVDGDRTVPMTCGEGGYHVASVAGTIVGDEYWYQLPDGRRLPDPASRHQPNGVHGPSAIVGPHFDWTDSGFRAPLLSELVLYEVHVGAFTAGGTFESAIAQLPELAELGVNAIELMPIAEFPGGRNWGYDGVAPFAAQSTYGGPDGLRALVDAAHAQGIAVFLDVVYNHLGPEGNLLHEWGPYFTSEYATPWGDALNFAGSGSDEVRRFFIESARWWVIDCHLDGLRVDAVHAIVDPSPRPFVEQLTEEIHRAAEEQGRAAVIIAESATNDPRTIRPAGASGGFGFDAQWSDDFHHALHALLTGERAGYYEDFGALADLAHAYEHGFTYDGRYSTYRGCSVGAGTGDIPGERFVVFAQNHDQIGNRMNGERLSALVGPAALRLAAAAVLAAPFVPLLFMGEAEGVTTPFPYFVSHGDPDLVDAVRKGRAREFAGFQGSGDPPDPQAESTFESAVLSDAVTEDGAALRSWYRRLLTLRRTQPQLCALDRDATSVSVHEREQSLVVARGRRAEVVVALHFGEGAVDVGLPAPGSWRVLADSSTAPPFDGARAARLDGAVVSLAPWGAVVLERVIASP